jgi:hypothetical protein
MRPAWVGAPPVAQVIQRAAAMAARWDAAAQVRALEVLVKASADAIMISKAGTSITARNLTAGRPDAHAAVPPSRRGLRRRTLARSSKRQGHGRGTSCSVRGVPRPWSAG